MLEYEGENRKERLKQVRKGPGVFVYDGTGMDHTSTPTIKRTDGSEPVLDDDGMPIMDKAGRMVTRPTGMPVLDDDGAPVLGGVPEVKFKKIKTYTLWGKDFKKGEEVSVASPKMARKLRCLKCFTEIGEEMDPRDAEIAALRAELANSIGGGEDEGGGEGNEIVE